LRFLAIILRVLRLEVSVYNDYSTNQFQTTFVGRGVGGGGGVKSVSRDDCEYQRGKLQCQQSAVQAFSSTYLNLLLSTSYTCPLYTLVKLIIEHSLHIHANAVQEFGLWKATAASTLYA
jgi:hypothetical protein